MPQPLDSAPVTVQVLLRAHGAMEGFRASVNEASSPLYAKLHLVRAQKLCKHNETARVEQAQLAAYETWQY